MNKRKGEAYQVRFAPPSLSQQSSFDTSLGSTEPAPRQSVPHPETNQVTRPVGVWQILHIGQTILIDHTPLRNTPHREQIQDGVLRPDLVGGQDGIDR